MKEVKNYSKPSLEHLAHDLDSTLLYKQFDFYNPNHSPNWHYHPEVEIVYVNEGNGKRQVGSHISNYNDGDLICIGSKLPHCGLTYSVEKKRKETLIQFLPEFLGHSFFEVNEMKPIGQFLEKAKKGLVFYGETKKEVGLLLEKMKSKNSFERLLEILVILNKLQKSNEYEILNAQGFAIKTEAQDNLRINKTLNFVQLNFKNPISIDEISEHVNMTPPAFCRNFKKVTGKTFTQFVNDYRLVHATKLLTEQQESVQTICYESGFNNFSHFNKLFKQHIGKTPTEYRKELNFVVD